MSENTEQFDFGIQRIWQHNKRLVIISTLGDMSRAAIDVWAEVIIETCKNWSAGSPLLLMHDLSHKNQGITPYSLKRAEDTYKAVPDSIQFQAYIAVVFSNNLATRLASVFFYRQRGKHKNVHEKLFVDKEAAQQWLESHMQPENFKNETA